MTDAAAGYAPIADADWPAQLDAARTEFAGALNVYRVMAHHPALLAAWADLRRHLVKQSALPAEAREVVTLRVGHRWGARYEWVQHVIRGRAAGLTDRRIAACAQAEATGPDAPLIEAVDQLLDDGRIALPLRRDLEQSIGRHALFDLIATVGFYSTLAFFINSFDVPLEPAMLAALAAAPLAD